MLRMHDKLTLRAMEGFVNSLLAVLALLGLALSCPNNTLFSKGRGRQLQVVIPRRPREDPVNVVVDATGLRVFGEGECKVCKHGVDKRRPWRSLHLGVEPGGHDMVAAVESTLIARASFRHPASRGTCCLGGPEAHVNSLGMPIRVWGCA